MKLDDFMKDLRSDVDAFEKHWRDEHKKDPAFYPIAMAKGDEGQWWEQFMAFQSMRGKGIDS